MDFDVIIGDNATSIKAILDRTSGDITNLANQEYSYYTDFSHGWQVDTLLRLPEFIKSLQPNWHEFMKVRGSDSALQQLLIYLNIDNSVHINKGAVDDKRDVFKSIIINKESL